MSWPNSGADGWPANKRPRSRRHGQSLIEFAVVALVTYLLLAAILTFGFYFYSAQGVQQAADLAAREISRTPFGADITFEQALADPLMERIYSDNYLVYDVEQLGNQDFFRDIVPTWPLLNQQLAPLMILDLPDFDGDGVFDARLLRYPGALLASETTPTHFTVGIPLVSRVGQGLETITWVPVIEEIRSPDDDSSPFQISSPQRGIVALRINYPVQAGAMSGFAPNAAGPLEPNISSPIIADDGSVSESNPEDRPGDLVAQPLLRSDGTYPRTPYGGTYGLGAQGAMGQVVRPFRRVISAQAIYRREVFE